MASSLSNLAYNLAEEIRNKNWKMWNSIQMLFAHIETLKIIYQYANVYAVTGIRKKVQWGLKDVIWWYMQILLV